MRFDIITAFPAMFTAFAENGVFGKGVKSGKIDIKCWNLRDFADNKHNRIDDRPFGGGSGMVLLPIPLQRALLEVKKVNAGRVILLSPQGRILDGEAVCAMAAQQSIILVCGRYRGIDERFIAQYVDAEISVGDYILSGGEVAAMVLMDAVSRFITDVLGNEQSLCEETFADGLLDAPCYTAPVNCFGMEVPALLRSGDHGAIRKWREEQSRLRTQQKRPDLWAAYLARSPRSSENGE